MYVGGIMEHVEEAGVHSGDSSCVMPPILDPPGAASSGSRTTRGAWPWPSGSVGLMNVQFIVRGEDVLVIECNPRASRTVPFISKATGVPLAKVATRVLLGEKLRDMDLEASDERALQRQGAGLSVRSVRGRGPLARPGDALDGRGDGDRPDLRRRFRQGAYGGRAVAAVFGSGVHLGGEQGQAGGRPDSARVRGPRVRGRGERRDGGGVEEQRALGLVVPKIGENGEDVLGMIEARRRGPDREHAVGQGRADGWVPDPAQSPHARSPLHHHPCRGRGRRPGNRVQDPRRRRTGQLSPGPLRRESVTASP